MKKVNKKGEMTQWAAVFLFLVVFLATFFAVFIYKGGIGEHVLNQIKADDLALGINSLFLLEGDVNLEDDLGEKYYVEEDEEKEELVIYRLEEEEEGRGRLIVPKDCDFAEQVKGKTNLVKIKKQGRSVVIT